ncbi:MAG: DoxX family protein [Pseudomonadota bacterium]
MANFGSDPLAIRLTGACLAAVFLYSAVTKALDRRAAVAEFADIGIPFATVALPAVVALQLLGGVALVIGVLDRIAAPTLAAFTVAAALACHRFDG